MSHATQLHDRGYLADDMQIMQRCALPGNVQDEVYRQVRARTVATVKWTLEQALDEELRGYVGRGRYERDGYALKAGQLTYDCRGLDHGVGHFRSLSITQQRHWLTYHFIATRQEGLCQVF